jgi:hypothetical protein
MGIILSSRGRDGERAQPTGETDAVAQLEW